LANTTTLTTPFHAIAATTPAQQLAHPAYRPDIDGLRALGVLLVVAFHAFPRTLPGGFAGVDIFFVVSGYLISTIIFGNLERDTFSFAEFYSRRIRRIFPALALVLATGWILGWVVLLVDEYKQLGLHIVSGAGFVSNFVLWHEAGYFDGDAYTKPFLHLWSLGIEEQFYIVWPLLLAVVWRQRHNFLGITILVAVGSFAANILIVRVDPVAAFYSPWSRFWELMAGGILAYLGLHRSKYLVARSNWPSAVGLVLIVLGVALLNKKATFPGWWALLPTMGTFLVIAAGPNAWLNRKFLSSRGMVWIGLISYPLYLWHWLLLSLAWIVKGRMPPSGTRMLLVVLSFVLSYLTYRFIEKQARAGGRVTTIVLVAIMVILMLAGFATYSELLRPRHDNRAIELILEALDDWEYPAGLNKTSLAGVPVKAREAGEKKVLFVGDSHIEQYSPRVVRLLDGDSRKYSSVVFLTSPGCAPVPGSAQVNSYHVERCQDFRERVGKLVLNPEISSVVIGAAWNLYLLKSGANYSEDIDIDKEIGKLENLIKSISTRKRVYFILDNASGGQFEPRNFFEGSRLTDLKVKPLPERVPLASDQEQLRIRLSKIATEAGAILIDPVAHLCPKLDCRAFAADGKPAYRDFNHFRASYVRESANFIDVALEK
jgi:peptidoglycan/LPS O-acetylase OafA/YrhL